MLSDKVHSSVLPSPPVTRASLMWLLAVQAAVLLPHCFEVAGWLPALWGAVVFWRWKIFQGAWNYPNKIHKTLVVLIASAGLWLTAGPTFGFITMLSLLLVGSILKLLEIKTHKDFVLLLLLSLFILAAQFIFVNHLLAAIYGFFCLLLIGAALMQLYQNFTGNNIWQRLRPTLVILAQALPVTAMLFVAMPRLGSLWSVPAPSLGKTGMSDSMAPGDFSQLVQSDELAFRVVMGADSASSELPPEVRYWRGLVFSQFDGQRWSQAKVAQSQLQPTATWRKKLAYRGTDISYEIVVEPSNKPWLYSLAAPRQWTNALLLGPDLNLQARQSLTQRFSYRVTSAMNYSDADAQTAEILQDNLQLPQWSNPQTQLLAKQWFAEAGSPEKLIEKLFAYYRSEFSYTLSPPALGNHAVDQFLWRSRQGFCEHFASSFVFFMRAAGIPARVVVGYQGGERNTLDHYLAVYQRDAHAWAEVWLEGRGWLRYDPTTAVAPERIRRGISESLSARDQVYLGKSFFTSFDIANYLYQRWDALNFQWVRWVLNYDSGLQSRVLSQVLQQVTPWRMLLLVLGIVLLSGLSTLALLFFRSRPRPLPAQERAVQLIYRQLCKKLQALAITPYSGEAPGCMMTRAAAAHPALGEQLMAIGNLYQQLAYAEDMAVLPALKRQLAKLPVNKGV